MTLLSFPHTHNNAGMADTGSGVLSALENGRPAALEVQRADEQCRGGEPLSLRTVPGVALSQNGNAIRFASALLPMGIVDNGCFA